MKTKVNNDKLLFLFLTYIIVLILQSTHSTAQENEHEELFIELPFGIDESKNEIYINQEKLKTIKLNKNRCKTLIIDRIDGRNLSYEKKLQLKRISSYPFMSGAKDTIAVFVNDQRFETEYKLLIIISLGAMNELRYFYTSMDSTEKFYEFNNFVFFDNEQFKTVNIKFKKNDYQFLILNPFFSEKPINKSIPNTKPDNKKWQISFYTGSHWGVSTLRYEPDKSQTISSIYYETKIINGFNLKMQVSYSVGKFLAGLYFGYENLNYENNTRIITSQISGGRIHLDYSENGNWPEQLFHYGLAAGYEFPAFEKFIICPMVQGGNFFYTGAPKEFDQNQNTGIKNHFKQKYCLGLGLQLKLPVNEQFWISADFAYHFNHFNASSYFVDIKPDSYHSRQELVSIQVGVCLKL